MNETLARALKAIAAESPQFDKSFELVDELVLAYGENALADRLITEIDAAIDWRVVAELFGILQWSTSDNGHAIAAAAERWLRECNDERKVNIALNLDTYPFRDKAEMHAVLRVVASKFPSSKIQCERLVASRP